MLKTALRLAGVLAFCGAIAACSPVDMNARHMVKVPQASVSRLASMGSSLTEPMVVRIFKEEDTLEVWKRTRDGSYKLFKSYDICAWSGDLGPKIKEGDRQSPEGFYTITPGLMNPNSSYFLSFNTGFPNKFDRAYGRTGSDLMVHGDCSSRGCYAMTDEQIAEIYALARESFAGGNRNFQLQIYPFRMTTQNLVRHRNSPHLDYWKNLKEGYDHFELTHRPPEWDVCNRRYVFNVQGPGGRPLDAHAACPALNGDQALLAQVAAKQAADDVALVAAIGKAEQDESRAVAAAEQAARSEAEAKARGEAMNQAVSGFFSGLFGGGNTNANAGTAPAQK